MTGRSSSLTIAAEPLTGRVARALIARLDADLAQRYPDPADNHLSLATTEVADGRGVFLVARLKGEPVGCGALRRIDPPAAPAPATGEIKRMYVDPSHRGLGIGGHLLAELERHALRLGLRRLVLETGERQAEALALYRRAGFVPIDRFGEYLDSPLSICLGKALGP